MVKELTELHHHVGNGRSWPVLNHLVDMVGMVGLVYMVDMVLYNLVDCQTHSSSTWKNGGVPITSRQ